MSLVIFIKHQLHALSIFLVVFSVHSHEKMIKWCCVLFLFFSRVFRPNIFIGIVLMAHQPLKPSVRKTLPRPDPRPELDTAPSYQILENTM